MERKNCSFRAFLIMSSKMSFILPLGNIATKSRSKQNNNSTKHLTMNDDKNDEEQQIPVPEGEQ